MSETDDDIGQLIRSKATRHMAPPQLRSRIDAMLAQQRIDLPVRQPSISAPRRESMWRRWLNLSGAFAVGMAASVAFLLVTRGNPDDLRIEEAVVDNHVRSLMGTHLLDVESTDKHTVKPWFAGKLDYAPPVRDLAKAGAPLVGGRLDYLGQRPVAALVYRANKHTINVFLWPETEKAEMAPVFSAHKGYNVAHWRGNGMQFWAISDLNVTELHNVVNLLAAADQP